VEPPTEDAGADAPDPVDGYIVFSRQVLALVEAVYMSVLYMVGTMSTPYQGGRAAQSVLEKPSDKLTKVVAGRVEN
jgi:hypothetical protein